MLRNCTAAVIAANSYVVTFACYLKKWLFLVKLPPKSISEHVIFKIFLGGMPPDPLALACFTCWLCFAQHSQIPCNSEYVWPPSVKHLPMPMTGSTPDERKSSDDSYFTDLVHSEFKGQLQCQKVVLKRKLTGYNNPWYKLFFHYLLGLSNNWAWK